MKKKIVVIILLFLIIISLIYLFNSYQKDSSIEKIGDKTEENNYSSNIIKNVNYSSKDLNGNQYIINADEGEIDISDPNVIYLKNVKGLIKLTNGNKITISSKYGKYNIDNYDTIFNLEVNVDYLDNNIIGQYLDVSINRNTLIMSKNVIYTNLKNILKADVIEMNIQTKDTKIFMYDTSKKVNIKSKN